MVGLCRNKVKISYRLYIGETEIIDEYGNATGEYAPQYSELKTAWLSITPNKGTSEMQFFGNQLDYDRTMTTSDTSLDIDEQSVLWLDGADTSKGYNFIVLRVAKSLNAIQYAIKQVDVNAVQSLESGGVTNAE